MKSLRDVVLTIGKKTYSVRTPLDNDALDRVKAFITHACGSEIKGAEQEDLLVLTCLRLAYALDAVCEKNLKTIARIDKEN